MENSPFKKLSREVCAGANILYTILKLTDDTYKLRDQIWEHVLHRGRVDVVCKRDYDTYGFIFSPKPVQGITNALALTRTSRTIHAETKELFIAKNEFALHSESTYDEVAGGFIRMLRLKDTNALKRIIIVRQQSFPFSIAVNIRIDLEEITPMTKDLLEYLRVDELKYHWQDLSDQKDIIVLRLEPRNLKESINEMRTQCETVLASRESLKPRYVRLLHDVLFELQHFDKGR